MVAAGSDVVAGVEIPGSCVEISVSGGGVKDWGVDDKMSVSFSDVVDSLVVVIGKAVDAVSVVSVGTSTGVVMEVRLGTAGVVSVRLVVLAVETESADVVIVADGTPDVVVVARLGATVGWPRVVDLVVTVGGLVPKVTRAVTGLMVDLSVTLGVTLVVTGTLRVVVRVMAVAVAVGVALAVDTSRVVTFSGNVVGLGAAKVEVDQDGGGVAAAVVDTSTLPVTGRVVPVISCMMTGLSVVTTSGGALVEAMVRGVSGAPGAGVTSFLVVVAAISAVEILGDDVVFAVVTVAAAEVAEVRSGFVVVTGRRGTSVVLVDVTAWMIVSEVTAGEDLTVGL